MGGQAASQQVDPAMQQITEFISTSINNGEDPIELVMTLVDQEVDQETIANVFMQVGYGQDDIITLFKQVEERMQPPGPASPQQQTQNPQEISRDQAMAEEAEMQEQQEMVQAQNAISQQLQAKSGIEIKPENKGKFTKWAEARGMSVQAAANKVMANTDQYPTSVVKMANFAKNAAGWNKQDGGDVSNYTEGVRQREGSYNPPNRKYTLDPRFKKEGGEFEPHFMYKGERKIRAKDMATHLRLKERGYTHDAPKAKGGKEMIKRADGSYSQRGMWDNIRANKGSGKKPTAEMLAQGRKIKSAQKGLEVDKKGNTFIDGVIQSKDEWTGSPNYVNPIAFESGNNFSMTDALQVLGTGYNQLLGGNDKDGDGLKDGAFRDLKSKNARADLNKGNYYNYEIKKDPNDPNSYGYDNLDLYNASIGEGGLRDLQTFTDDVNENSRVNYNPETGKYDALMSSRKLDKNIFGNLNAFTGENLNYFNNIDDDTKQALLDYGNSSANGMPEGTTLSIDPETGAVGYMNPDADNPNEYDTMMGYNTFGKGNLNKPATNSSMIPTGTNGQPVAGISNTNQLSFKEWSMQAPVTRTGANAPQQYQDYLNGVQSNSTIQSNQPNLLDKIGTGLNEAGAFIKDKYNEAAPFIQEGINQAGEFVKEKIDDVEGFITDKFGKKKTYKVGSTAHKVLDPTSYKEWEENNKLRYGGGLPKAQGGMFDFDFTPYFKEDQLEDQSQYFSSMLNGATNYMEDTQAVADAQLQNETPELGPTPNQEINNAMFTPDGQQSNSLNSFLPEEDVEFSDPTVKRTGKLQGGIARVMDSPAMKGYGKASEFAVQGARVVNNFFDDRAIEDAQADNRNNMVADNLYATKENPMLKRGSWDINTGTFGSEGQRTVKKGGEIVNVNSAMLAKLIAAGADIEML